MPYLRQACLYFLLFFQQTEQVEYKRMHSLSFATVTDAAVSSMQDNNNKKWRRKKKEADEQINDNNKFRFSELS